MIPLENGMIPLPGGMMKAKFSEVEITAQFCGKRNGMKNVFDIIANPDRSGCTILLYGEIGDYAEVRAEDVLAQIIEAEKTYGQIDIRINSIGGQVGTGIAIFNALKDSNAEITIYIDCLAASTASIIAACGRRVKMSKYARILIHKPTGGIWGNAEEIKTYQEQLVQIEDIICDIYSRRTGMSVEEIRSSYMDGGDHWLTADEAVRLGFADEVYDGLPVTAEDMAGLPIDQRCGRFTDLYVGTFNNQHKPKRKMFDTIKKLQPFSDCADEAAVMARLVEIAGKAEAHDALKAENDALKAKLADIESREKAAQDAAINAEVDAAVKDGRIDETQREKYVRLLHSSEAESARAILQAQKAKRMVKDILDDGTVVDGGSWAKRQEEIRDRYNGKN